MRIILLFFVLLFFISANAQTFQWAGAFIANLQANSIKTDSKGNVYTTGSFADTVDFDPGAGVYNLVSAGANDIFISKLDAYGNFVWAKSMGGISNEGGQSIAVDTLGGVYITGSFENTADFDPGPGVFNMISQNYEDIFISKLDSNGNFVWAKRIGSSVGYDKGSSITTDAIGNIYITGGFDYTVDFDPGPGVLNMTAAGYGDIFIIKLDSNGNLVWVNQSGDPISDRGDYITVDNLGQAYIAGWGSDWPNNNIYIIISKINSNGSFIWTKKMSNLNANDMEVKAISIDATNNVYTSGHFMGTIDFDPGVGIFNLNGPGSFISKLNSNGNFVWAKKLNGYHTHLIVDKFGNIYTASEMIGGDDMDPGPGVYNLTGNIKLGIRKLDPNGNFLWAKGMEGTGSAKPTSITVDTVGNIYATGIFNDDLDFDPGPNNYTLTAPAPWYSAFVLKLNECGAPYTTLNLSFCDSALVNGITYYNTGNYVQTFSDINGCDSNFAINLTINYPSTQTLNETACTTFTLNGQTYTASGTYTQTLVNAANCDSVITLNLTIDSVDASVTQAAALLTANATLASYQWLACNPFQAITGETNQNFVATANGDYAVAVTQNGCTDTSACYTVNGVVTQDFSVTNSIHLFPNPVKQNLLIQSQYPLQDANIKILSITGQVAREYNHISTDKFTIDMSSFVSGNYFIEIADKKNKYVRKVFKE